MADGRTHQKVASIVLLVGTAAAAIAAPSGAAFLGDGAPILWGMVGGLLMGWVLTPDLDVDGETIEETRIRGIPIIGPVLYVIFRGLFAPYAILMPHRSTWSHGIGIGTALRMAYVTLLIYAITRVWIWTLLPPWALLGAFFGWAVQDLGHFLLDVTNFSPTFRQSSRVSWRNFPPKLAYK